MKERAAIALTTIWVGGAAAIILVQSDAFIRMPPNEWGDFFAGVFSPIALLWLVLGYFQQGKELRLQVEELRRSVEQQKELAQATKSEVEVSRKLQISQEERERREAQPRFVITQRGPFSSKTETIWFHLTNRGAHVDDISISSSSGVCKPGFVGTMEHGGNFQVDVKVTPGMLHEIPIKISYRDSIGNEFAQEFNLVRLEDGNYQASAPLAVDV